MKHKIYILEDLILRKDDTEARAFNLPMFATTQGEMERNLQLVHQNSDKRNLIAQFPQNFNVYQIGIYDDETGAIIPQAPEFKFNIADIISTKTQ